MTSPFEFPNLEQIEATAQIVYGVMPPTPQYSWPTLNRRVGAEVWVKHENHTPIGAFKVRGGICYLEQLAQSKGKITGVIAATRGNHGQSIGFAARLHGIAATIIVPNDNSVEKNRAMQALGVTLIEQGADFQDALEYAYAMADRENLDMAPSFDPILVTGVATYAWELFKAVSDLDAVYVPIGLGSGICGTIAVREALARSTEIIGVVSDGAPTYALSLAQRCPVCHEVTTTLADGLACRTPNPTALNVILDHVQRVVRVTDAQVAEAMRILFSDTHNLAEGAGAAGLAALLIEREKMRGKKVAVVLTGGNVDQDVLARVLSGR